MGQTPRTAAANARAREQRQWAELMTKAKPESLTESEVELTKWPLVKAPEPRPVLAWVRYAGHPVRAKGWTAMWTDRAVKVRWLTPLMVWHQAWVWEGAVQPRQAEVNERAGERLGLSPNSPRDGT